MRTLNFIVNGQILEPDPNCNFDDLVPGSEGYVRASFTFTNEWLNCAKVAAFFSALGKEYPPQKLDSNLTCVIPSEALKKRTFKIQILGKQDDIYITTNKLPVTQNGGKL